MVDNSHKFTTPAGTALSLSARHSAIFPLSERRPGFATRPVHKLSLFGGSLMWTLRESRMTDRRMEATRR